MTSSDAYTQGPHRTQAEWARLLEKSGKTEDFQAAYNDIHSQFLAAQTMSKRQGCIYGETLSRHDLLVAALIIPPKSVVDIGCGDGRLSIHLASLGNTVTGVDVSDVALESARATLAQIDPSIAARVRLAKGDARNLPIPDASMDAAVSCDFVEHITRDMFVHHLAEVRRILKPEGLYALYTPSRLYSPGPSGLHLHEYSIGDLAAIAKDAGFQLTPIDLRLFVLSGRIFRTPQCWIPFITRYERLLALIGVNHWNRRLQRILVFPSLAILHPQETPAGERGPAGTTALKRA